MQTFIGLFVHTSKLAARERGRSIQSYKLKREGKYKDKEIEVGEEYEEMD